MAGAGEHVRRFTVYRQAPPDGYLEQGHANPPDAPQFEGVVFTDGTVAVRWMTAYRSHSIWPSLQDLFAVHGHPEYGTRVEWHDDLPPIVHEGTGEAHCRACQQDSKPGEQQLAMFGPFIPMDLDATAAAIDKLAGQRDRRWR